MGRSLLLVLLLFYFNVNSSSTLPSSSSLNSTPLCLARESSALLQFKSTLSIDSSVPYHCQSTPRPKINSWNETTNCCLWDGITCDKVTAHVIALDLSCSWLVGSLPGNTTLFLPRRLQRLSLSLNNLNGPIPSTLFTHLVRLTHLDLSTNDFSGLIPSEISHLSQLVSLDLSRNSDLTLDEHSFDMLARNLSKLTNLNFKNVNMSCVPPSSLLNLTSTLKCLSLSSCALNGELPVEVFRFPYLQYLDLSWNLNLAGYLPKSNWSSPLEFLDISSCNFSGQLPPSLGNLTQLSFLDLVPNSFGGEIPDVFGSLKKLAGTLWLNSFNGQLPPSIFNLSQVTSLVLTGNLEGEFPAHVSGLQNLEDLYLSGTLISGAIPSWLFALPFLKSLKLSNNKLLSLPTDDQIQKPSSIQVIDLGLNHIHGSIPSFLFDHLVNLTDLDLSSNNLSGVITSDMLAKAKSLQTLDVSSNNQLSLSSSSGHVNYTFDALHWVEFSSCNITRFPSFFRTAKNLTYLSLSNNKIQGSISKWESEGWEQLIYLYLSNNSLSSIEQYPGQNLQELDVSSNQLHGPLLTPPPSMFKFLMSNNNLTGEIPTSFCNLTALGYLDLSTNNLGGIIPSCLSTTCLVDSIDIKLQFNHFHGNIPDFGSDSIQTLALNDNQFEGLLPRSLVNCTSLIFLNVANNKLNDTFPHWLGILPQLQLLVLRSNGFHGPLENAIAPSSFLSLEIIDLSGNAFSGTLPTNLLNLTAMKHERGPCDWQCINYLFPYQSYVEIVIKRLQIQLKVGEKTSGFTIIDFSDNQFYGEIPKVLGELGSLLVLNLSHNHLTGSIPPTLGHMAALESLDLSSNKLGGKIPPELTNLIFLEVLNLSHNNLSGLIPQGNQFNTFDNDSYIGNPGLWGCPLSKECHNIFKKQPQPSFVDQHEDGDGDDDSGIPFIWKVAAMGYGCGIVLGLSIGYIMFTIGRPWWIVGKIERYLQQRVTNWICKIQGRRRRRN
ncbi:hypothetical protein COLO4_25516 [Corchorus olitorius]|uniref:Leucine-rich repeat-containing N-terminal plant-type domain-containing protein n=1 Tax=Corchorus olitorius TaxID=93759 RepID=A0A1R3I1X8_9ROSI|nr:hypothetical protein COLO4_25516 [Corchorus olitorius]